LTYYQILKRLIDPTFFFESGKHFRYGGEILPNFQIKFFFRDKQTLSDL